MNPRTVKAAALACSLSVLFGCTVSASEIKESSVAAVMGTDASAVIYGARGIADQVMDMLADSETDWLSWRVEGSDIYNLNLAAENKESYVPKEKTLEYLSRAQELKEKSGGAFDVTIGALSRLWGLGTPDARVPDADEIEALLPKEQDDRMCIDGDTVWVQQGAYVDLGAIGKGIGCQEAEVLLENTTASGAVVAVGGSVLLYGEKGNGKPWRVKISNPRKETGDSALGTLTLTGTQYVSTSGDYEKYLMEDGKRYHHILDPHTGYPAQSGLISVTIVCKEGWLSDGLSTACFVLGYENSLELLKAYDAEAIFVDENHSVCVTEGLKEAFELSGTSYELVDTL